MDVIRVSYYTSVIGDDQKVSDLENYISGIQFSRYSPGARAYGSLLPRVHKKSANSKKSKVVDVDITMDVMRGAADAQIETILLLTGDGDYVPLVREITRRTSKQVVLGAFSSGLSPKLRVSADTFLDLDGMFFQPVLNPE